MNEEQESSIQWNKKALTGLVKSVTVTYGKNTYFHDFETDRKRDEEYNKLIIDTIKKINDLDDDLE